MSKIDIPSEWTQERRERAAAMTDRAIARLEESGWCRNELKDRMGRVCLNGSLIYSTPDGRKIKNNADNAANSDVQDTLTALVRLQGPLPGSQWRTLDHVYWNDSVARDKRQVIRLLRKAGRILRGAAR